MRCQRCGKETEVFLENNEPICTDCAVELGYTLCLETGKYKDFSCSNVCSDCEWRQKD